MKEAFRFAAELLFSPSKAAKRLAKQDAALRESLWIYAAFIAVSIAFYTWKPESFPPPSPDMPMPLLGPGDHGFLFWTQVQLWEPVLSALWILCLAAFLGLFRTPFASLPAQIALGAFAGVVPAVPLILYKRGVIAGWAFLLCWAALLGAFAPLMRRRPLAAWKPLVSFALALNVINLALAFPICLTVFLELPAAYNGLHYAILFWTLGLGAYLLSKVEGITTPRASVALVLSLVWQMLLVFSLHLLGLVSKDILKAMMSV